MRATLAAISLMFISSLALASHGAANKPSHLKTASSQPKRVTEKVSVFLSSLTPDRHSALQSKIKQEQAVQKSPYAITYDEPTYILPFYYTNSPSRAIYRGHTPDNQRLDKKEFKAQFSFLVPLWLNILKSKYSLNASYTQLFYWQFYTKSQYFRETNYMPALFISDNFQPNWLASLGVAHQSNGRGGPLERSWNRLFLTISFSGKRWLIRLKPWILIFKQESSDLHNQDIAHYLGNGEVVLAYKYHQQAFSVMFRNVLESGFSRGAVELGYQFPIYGKLSGYVQLFSGYGQSLIEYNHYTNSAGIGIVLGNWI